MSGMKDRNFVLGDSRTVSVTAKKDGSAYDLTGKTIRLRFNDIDGVVAAFEKDSGTDTDWITVTDATNGVFSITVADYPTGIPVTGGRFWVGARVEDGTTATWFGTAVYTWDVPPEGAWTAL